MPPLHIQSSGIILILQATYVPNFVSFATSTAELPDGEQSSTQSINHSAYVMPGNRSLSFGQVCLGLW